jgi:transposase-like protein
MIERLNQEIRRRERAIRIFQNRESAMRLIGALLVEQDEAWPEGRKYFVMTEYREWIEKLKSSDESSQAEQPAEKATVFAH